MAVLTENTCTSQSQHANVYVVVRKRVGNMFFPSFTKLTKIQSETTRVVTMAELLRGGIEQAKLLHGFSPTYGILYCSQKVAKVGGKTKATGCQHQLSFVRAGHATDASELSFTSQRPRAHAIPRSCFGKSCAGHSTPSKMRLFVRIQSKSL